MRVIRSTAKKEEIAMKDNPKGAGRKKKYHTQAERDAAKVRYRQVHNSHQREQRAADKLRKENAPATDYQTTYSAKILTENERYTEMLELARIETEKRERANAKRAQTQRINWEERKSA